MCINVAWTDDQWFRPSSTPSVAGTAISRVPLSDAASTSLELCASLICSIRVLAEHSVSRLEDKPTLAQIEEGLGAPSSVQFA